MYDIIGDIHGHAEELVQLLEILGYEEWGGCFRHATRKVIYCGDFIDRGSQIPDVVRIARSMVEGDAALAVMGNHEFNALAYHTEDPQEAGSFLRAHDSRNRHQHAETIRQFSTTELSEALAWFRTLPAALDLGTLRVVHACWSQRQLQIIADATAEHGAFTPAFLKHATTPGEPLFGAVECVMKGPELSLPPGITVKDKEGNVRKRIRIRWFESAAEHTWRTYSLPAKDELPAEPVPVDAPAVPYADDAPPVFVGHYWLPDCKPFPLAKNIACLDYSIAKAGLLCSYRFDGEQILSADKFVTVPARDTGASP